MPRPRSPDRAKAFEIYKEHNGNIENRRIAEILGRPEKTVGGWKCKDAWESKLNGVLQTKERSTPKERGAQPGNQNAVGHGGTGPPGNKNAVKHGAYETIYLNALPEEERAIFESIPTADDQDGEIRLLRMKLARLISRDVISTYDVYGVKHKREITEAEREKGILEITAEIRKLIKTKKQIQLAEIKAGAGETEEIENDGFMAALEGAAAEDWTDEG